MSYLLVVLHRDGDESTNHHAAWAQKLRERQPTPHFFLGDAPRKDKVQESLDVLRKEEGEAKSVLFGHCDRQICTLRAQAAREPIWCDAEGFGELFRETFVYVVACETVERGDNLDDTEKNLAGSARELFQEVPLYSFGQSAVMCGVRLFVGHAIKVQLPETPESWKRDPKKVQALEQATLSVFEIFLSSLPLGENESEVSFQKKLRRAFSESESLVSDYYCDGDEGELDGDYVSFLGIARFFQLMRDSLFVLGRKTNLSIP